MKFTIAATLFKKIIDAVKDLVKDTSFEFTENGIVLNAMDSSHVTLVHMTIKSSLLAYEDAGAEVIGVHMEGLSRVLKTCENDCEIRCENTECKLLITTKSDGRDMNFSQNLLDLEVDSMMVPDINYPCKIEMTCSELQKLCRDLREFGDSVQITVSPSSFKLLTTSSGEHIEINYTANQSVKIQSEASMEMSFSLKYLILFCKACPLSDSVSIYIGCDQPMCVKFPISESEHLSFYLAPKVD